MSKLDCGDQTGSISSQSGLYAKNQGKKQKLDFQIAGRFLGFLATADREAPYKYFRLHTSRGEHTIKLAKSQRAALGKTLGQTVAHGAWLEVSGTQKFNPATGITKFKAAHVVVKNLAVKERILNENQVPAKSSKSSKPRASILICQKSDCVKRGSGKICEIFTQTLHDRALSDRVQIKSTGCLKDCDAGPCLVVMPTKKRHNKVKPKHIPAIVDAIGGRLALVN